jgi:hypothetical protein
MSASTAYYYALMSRYIHAHTHKKDEKGESSKESQGREQRGKHKGSTFALAHLSVVYT